MCQLPTPVGSSSCLVEVRGLLVSSKHSTHPTWAIPKAQKGYWKQIIPPFLPSLKYLQLCPPNLKGVTLKLEDWLYSKGRGFSVTLKGMRVLWAPRRGRTDRVMGLLAMWPEHCMSLKCGKSCPQALLTFFPPRNEPRRVRVILRVIQNHLHKR